MLPRDPARLESSTFDVLVVGGGIYGLAIAYEAASRGLVTALIEAADFGSATSFNHQKTAHGGLRSLQSMRFDRALEAIRERRALARMAPWFLRPMPFIVGTYRSVMKSRTALRAAFLIDRTLGRRRNEGVERELHLPAPRLLSRAITLKLFPGIDPRNLTGGAQWYDYQMVHNDRLTYAFAEAAARAGATVLNYVEAVGAMKEGGRIAGMEARDVESGRPVAIRAHLTINAAGAGTERVRRMFGVDQPLPLLAAMNLVARKAPKEVALAAPTAEGRMLTLVPWQGHVVVGTSHSTRTVNAGDSAPTRAEIDGFVKEANEAFPALGLTRDEITLVHRGLVPAVVGPNDHPDLQSGPSILDHSRDGAAGAVTVIGVKYTTARGVAERAINLAARLLGKSLRDSATATTVLPSASIGDHAGLAIETAKRARLDVAPATITRLSELYAEGAAEIIRMMAAEPALQETLGTASAATGAEVAYVIRRESAIHLTDVVLRRTALGAAAHPGADVVANAGAFASRELGWDAVRLAKEVAAVEAAYRVP